MCELVSVSTGHQKDCTSYEFQELELEQQQDQITTTDKGRYVYIGSKFTQWYSAFAANFGVFSVGCVWSWTSTALPSLKSSGALGPITPSDEAWITSIAFLGGIVSCFLAGFSIQKFGLRTNMLIQTFPLLGGWLLVTFAIDLWMMLAGRFLSGFFVCGLAMSVPAFVAETTEVSLRGKLGFGYDVLGSFGVLYIFFVGTCITSDWRWQAAACGITPIIFHILMLFVPESPLCLIRRGQSEDEAFKALCWFRGCSAKNLEEEKYGIEMVKVELEDMIKSVQKLQLIKESKKNWKSEYLNSQTLKPTLICVILMIFYQLTGGIPVFAYTLEIFQAAGSNNSELGTVIVGFVQLLFTVLAGFYVEKLGRKILLITSEILIAIPLIILGIYMYLKSEGAEYQNFIDSIPWVPVVTLVFYSASFAIGMAPIVWVITGELIPPAAKGFSSAIITITNRGLGFIVVFFFHDLMDLLGQHGCYWFFAISCLIGAVYIAIFVPETKGKSLDEINKNFVANTKKCERL